MSETTPIVDPNLSAGTITTAASEISNAAAPFIPAKIRAGIYSIGGLVIVVAGAVAPVVGGTVGNILDVAASAVGALVGAVAVSHVSK